ncbi:retrovirus-related Pol polyprotein from transposon 17.6 [Trichonephila clavipes]|nr:retrovirus-related Pol polyprotein from transposon 17.6 [Trichonephila clavipes]
MRVGDLPTIAGIEIGGMQKYWNDKMIGEIIIEGHAGIGPSGTSFKGLFSVKPGLPHVLYHEIDTGDKPLVVPRPYRYDRVKEGIIDYPVKMLRESTIIPIQWPYPSPVVLCHKNYGILPDNPEAYRFAEDYHLRSEYFQLAVKPSDVVETAFVTKNGTFVFKRRPFGLSGAAPNFQKEAELTLNKDKCNFGCEKLKYLGLVISKDGITPDESKVKALIEVKPPKNSRGVLKFLGMTQWYQKFIKNYIDICEPLYQLKRKFKKFSWSEETQVTFEAIKQVITEAPVLKLPDFNTPFELFTDASSIGIGALLTQEQRTIAYIRLMHIQ